MLTVNEQDVLEDAYLNYARAKDNNDESPMQFNQRLIDKYEAKKTGTYTGITTNPNGSKTIDLKVATPAIISAALPGGVGDFLNSLVAKKSGASSLTYDEWLAQQKENETGQDYLWNTLTTAQITGESSQGLAVTNSIVDFLDNGAWIPLVVGGGAIALMVVLFKTVFGGRK